MSRCNHPEAQFTIEITRKLTASVTDFGAGGVATDTPTQIRLMVWCSDCGYTNIETTYANGVHASEPWRRWPKWIMTRMTLLRTVSPHVDEAMRALHFDVPV